MYVAVKVDEDKCIGCKICITTCPDPNVITFRKHDKKVEINDSRCKSCELCVVRCPKGALELSDN